MNEEWITSDCRIEQVLFTKPGNPLALQPNQTKQLTEMVGLRNEGGGLLRVITERCTKMKQDARYVIFISRHEDSSLWVDNFNVGRFNIDGTDPEDEIGGGFLNGSRTTKQRFRDELMAPPYNIVFQTLPGAHIVSARYVYDGPPPPNVKRFASEITVSVDTPQTETSVLVIEKQSGDGAWQVINQVPVGKSETVVRPISGSSEPYANDSLRVRVVNGDKTSNYSASFLLK